MMKNPDALPQLIGEFKPTDEWQAHITRIFYGLRAGRLQEYYQTFASADYCLAHALAADYYAHVQAREKARGCGPWAMGKKEEAACEAHRPLPIAHSLIIHEWGCGNGNLAACFLSHLKKIDTKGAVYPRVRYVLVDNLQTMLEAARAHPDLVEHQERIEVLRADVQDLGAVEAGTVDFIVCNELWNDLPAKLMLRKGGEVEEEFLRPNLSESKHAMIADWSGFVRAFEATDIQALGGFPPFLEDIVWEKEYRKIEWKPVPYRKTISEFLKKIDEHVLVPVNLGACATLEEAKRVLAPDAVGFSSFDAGTADLTVLNDPEKPCFTQIGGQYSVMVNVALVEAVAKHLGIPNVAIEPQKEFVGRSLGINVLSLMDLLATYPSAGSLSPWEQDRLILKTIRVLNEGYRSPYHRKIEFPIRQDMPKEEREVLEGILDSLKQDGVPDTIAYLSEQQVVGVMQDLGGLGYDPDLVKAAVNFQPQSVDYCHLFFRPKGFPGGTL
jgi:hypothetical protein